MDNNYLDKVIDQIVSETRIDHDEEMLYTPFSPPPFSLSNSFTLVSLFFSPYMFSHHCKNIYGLNEDEVSYVWKKYKEIIKDMLPY
jgi:hypothetical protein